MNEEIFNIENIKINVNVKDKKELFKEIAQMLFDSNSISNTEEYINALFEREKEFSTGIGYGFAIPHARCSCVNFASVAVVKMTNEIEYESFDDESIKIVFAIAVPEGESDGYMKILSSLSRKLMHDDFRELLNKANSTQQILAIMNSIVH